MDELAECGAEFELHYAYHSPEHADHVFSYVDSEGCALNLDELISSQPKGTHVYVCGPKPMIDAVIDCCNKHRYRDEYIHWEHLPQQFLKMVKLLQ